MTNSFIEINNRRIGPGYPTYIIAEISANHGQNFECAVNLVKAAKESGADAVKLQTFTPDTHTIRSDKNYFRVSGGTPWDGRTLYDLYQEAYMPWEWQPKLKLIADELGIDLFSSAVDPTSVVFLQAMDVPAYKVSSFEIVDLQLIEKLAQTGKPLIISTGMSTLAEIDEAVQTARNAGANQIILLKCTSSYPAPPTSMNLRTIPHMSQAFQVPVGISDHTSDIAVPVTAVALGACMIEKHYTLSRATPTLDSGFSLEPHEFKAMVDAVRTTEKACGDVNYGLNEYESKNRIFRRSLFVVKDVNRGERFTSENVRSIRPYYGLHTRYLTNVIGRRARNDIERGTPLSWDLIDGGDSFA